MEAKITPSQLEKVARLASLDLTSEEKQRYTQDLTEIIDYNMSLLEKVNVEGVEPTAHVGGLAAKLRPDETSASLTQEEALKNAPRTQEGYFKVAAIIDVE